MKHFVIELVKYNIKTSNQKTKQKFFNVNKYSDTIINNKFFL